MREARDLSRIYSPASKQMISLEPCLQGLPQVGEDYSEVRGQF